MVSDGYAFLVEMLFEAQRRGLRIGEAPIIFVERRLGTSKLSSNVLIESLIMPWRLVFRPRPQPGDRATASEPRERSGERGGASERGRESGGANPPG